MRAAPSPCPAPAPRSVRVTPSSRRALAALRRPRRALDAIFGLQLEFAAVFSLQLELGPAEIELHFAQITKFAVQLDLRVERANSRNSSTCTFLESTREGPRIKSN